MHRGPELSIDHADYLVTILAILFAERRDQKVVGVLQDPRAKGERDTMVAAIGIVFLRVELRTACAMIIYILWSRDAMRKRSHIGSSMTPSKRGRQSPLVEKRDAMLASSCRKIPHNRLH